MPISPKLVAVAASAAVLVTGTGLAVGANQAGQQTVAAVAVPAPPTELEIHVRADDAAHTATLSHPTVGAALGAAGVSVGQHDRVSPAFGTFLADGEIVTVTRAEVTHETTIVPLAFTTTEVKDSSLAKGERKVKTEGAEGTREDVTETITLDGVVQSSNVISQTVTKEPVNRVIRVGTKVAPKITSRSSERTAPAKDKAKKSPKKESAKKSEKSDKVEKSEQSEQKDSSKKSSHEINLARADMWDRIAKCESGGRWNINTGNGYYGGLQFNLGTWRSVNGTDFAAYPHQASRAEQITVANRLYAKRGLQPWGCRHAA
ncbi:MAG: transglycosylase family protein [Propionibacteriaceae bacterium]|nr:transglycosylase family protein [Propionibacteriaceae bacterium]